MIYPPIDKILNTVDSKYKLVHIVSKRSKQMEITNHYQMAKEAYKSQKNLGRALEEVSESMIRIK